MCLQEELAQVVGNLGVPLSSQGLDKRFGPQAVGLLEQVLQNAVLRVISTEPAAVPLLQRFTGVDLLDTTTVSLPSVFARVWPGSGAHKKPAALKAQVRLDLLAGTLTGPFLFPAREHIRKGRCTKRHPQQESCI